MVVGPELVVVVVLDVPGAVLVAPFPGAARFGNEGWLQQLVRSALVPVWGALSKVTMISPSAL